MKEEGTVASIISLNPGTEASIEYEPRQPKVARRTEQDSARLSSIYKGSTACWSSCRGLKVPKCENIDVAFFTLINPIWVCDLGTGKNYHLKFLP